MITYIIIALIIISLWLHVRTRAVSDYRRQWYTILKNAPESHSTFTRSIASYNRMVFSWKPLRDKYWIPKELVALRSVAALSPEDRKKLIAFINRNPDRYPPGAATEAWKATIRKMDERKTE